MVRRFIQAFCLVCSASGFAANPVLGPYLGLMGSVAYAPTLHYNVNWPTSFTTPYGPIYPQTTSLNYSVGGGGGAELGFRFECLRIEAELLYVRNNMSQLKVGSTTVGHSGNLGLPYMDGQTTSFAGIANFYYDFYGEDDATWVPYVGIGVGYNNTRSSTRIFNASHTFIIGTETVNSSTGLMGQGIFGLSYYMDNVSDVFVDLRYLTSQKNNAFNTRRDVYTANIGFNFVFDEMSIT